MRKTQRRKPFLCCEGKLCWRKTMFVSLLLSFLSLLPTSTLYAQGGDTMRLTGVVVDETGETIPGAAVMVKGTTTGVITDFDGKFEINASKRAKVLEVSFIGLESQEVVIGKSKTFKVTLKESNLILDEVVVVGYGQQKKESIVGAIVQAGSEELERVSSVTNMGQALTGLLPGVSTIQVSGMPGEDDPTILIRGQSTWNNSAPLVLVDGIERSMNDIDVSEVESISVLKDASATAVFGVKGAEGVILITTKRGTEGKAQFNFSSNVGFKFLAKMANKLDSYDSFMYQNAGIEREVASNEASWAFFTPMDVVNRYRYRESDLDGYIYPDVDWTDAMTKDFALTQRYNLNVNGGSKFTQYFASLSYMKEGDLLDTGDQSALPYESEYSYERYNYRTNLDFNITPSTIFTVNLSGYLGIKHGTNVNSEYDLWRAFYTTPSGVFPVRHEDGTWGYTALNAQITNPVRKLTDSGSTKRLTTQVNTDFILKQELDFITPGLKAQGTFSYDNTLVSKSGIYGTTALSKYIDPITGNETFTPVKGNNEYDYTLSPNAHYSESVQLGSTVRRLFYQLQLSYARKFDAHDIGATALFNREEYASGSVFPYYREDWVGRVTYNYGDRYFLEANGAYNGSEKFGKDFRFGFFPSVALGWMVSNEKFLSYDWLDKLKLRYSIGLVGNDNFNATRWSYVTQWAVDGDCTKFGPWSESSPYTQYIESVVGNPALQWETSRKQNLGLELSVLKGMFSGTFDLFQDDRDNIFLTAGNRTVIDYFGASPVSANLGKTKTQGYEFELTFRDNIGDNFNYWATYSYTHAKDEIIYCEDAPLLPNYQKDEGFSINQTTTLISESNITNWDDVYASVKGESNNAYRLPGDINVVDFNGDGLINDYDKAPFGYSPTPQNTYNLSLGGDYKGLSLMVQLYGVFNTTRFYGYNTTTGGLTCPLVYEYLNDYWTADNIDSQWKAPRSSTESYEGSLNYYDGSYLRLKNIELGYTLPKSWLLGSGLNSLKLTVSAYNLGFWSKLPEDRETSLNTGGSGSNLYPNMKRINVGLNVTF